MLGILLIAAVIGLIVGWAAGELTHRTPQIMMFIGLLGSTIGALLAAFLYPELIVLCSFIGSVVLLTIMVLLSYPSR